MWHTDPQFAAHELPIFVSGFDGDMWRIPLAKNQSATKQAFRVRNIIQLPLVLVLQYRPQCGPEEPEQTESVAQMVAVLFGPPQRCK